MPASYCAILGFRPSWGSISLEGARPLAPSFDTAGFFARDGPTLAAVGSVLFAAAPGPAPLRPPLVREPLPFSCAAGARTGPSLGAAAEAAASAAAAGAAARRPPGALAAAGLAPLFSHLLIAEDAFALASPEAAAALRAAIAAALPERVTGCSGPPVEIKVRFGHACDRALKHPRLATVRKPNYSNNLAGDGLLDLVRCRAAEALCVPMWACPLASGFKPGLPGPAWRTQVAGGPGGLAAWLAAFRTVQMREAWAEHGAWLSTPIALGGSSRLPQLGPGVADRFAAASRVSADEAEAASRVRRHAAARMDALLGDGAPHPPSRHPQPWPQSVTAKRQSRCAPAR